MTFVIISSCVIIQCPPVVIGIVVLILTDHDCANDGRLIEMD